MLFEALRSWLSEISSNDVSVAMNDISICIPWGGGVTGSCDDQIEVTLGACEAESEACEMRDQLLDAVDDLRPSHAADNGVRSPDRG